MRCRYYKGNRDTWKNVKGNIIPGFIDSVKPDFCEYIEDAYTELLLAEEKGLIKITDMRNLYKKVKLG